MTINQRLFKILEEKNIKMSQLANHLGLNRSIISAWKIRQTEPPIQYTVQICNLLGISIEYYITGKENNFTIEEQELLTYFRQLPTNQKQRELGRLEALAMQHSAESGSTTYKTG